MPPDGPAPQAQPRGGAAGLFLFVWLALFSLLALHQLPLPAPAPASAPREEFSADRALAHLWKIAGQPRPVGTPEHARVRAYILAQLSALGLQPQVQETVAIDSYHNRSGNSLWAARVFNVIARLPGRQGSSRPILMMTHYDSTPGSPGASDAGAPVAMLLETLRALRAAAPLKNDLIVLFTDHEETDLFGVRAFAAHHPWAADIGAVLNFEARGGGGPVLMFETGPANGWLVRELARAPYPVASSLMSTVYRYIPNGTDFTVLRKRGAEGLNFAFIDRPTVYHRATDTVENLDPRTLQQLGVNALALARRLGDLDLRRRPAGDAVFFNALGYRLLVYPVDWALPLAGLAAVVLCGVAALGLRRGRLTAAGMARGALAYGLSLLAAPLAAAALLWLVFKLDPSFSAMLGPTYNSPAYYLAFAALALAAISATYALFQARTSLADAAMGGLFGGLALLLLTAVFLPGGSYLLTWPTLASSLAMGLWLAGPERETPSRAGLAALAVGALPAVFLIVPWIALLFLGMTVLMAWAVVLFAALLAGLLVPHLYLMMGHRRWWLPAAAGALALGCVGAALASPGFDARHPRPDSILYALDSDTRQALWASLDDRPDAWTAQFLAGSPQRRTLTLFVANRTRRFLQAPAPVLPLPPPEAALLGGRDLPGGGREVALHVRSPRGGQAVRIDFLEGPEMSVTVDGQPTGEGDPPKAQTVDRLLYFAPPPQGFDLVLQLRDRKPLRLNVVDYTLALPGLPFKPRPAGLMPQSAMFSETTLLRRSYSF